MTAHLTRQIKSALPKLAKPHFYIIYYRIIKYLLSNTVFIVNIGRCDPTILVGSQTLKVNQNKSLCITPTNGGVTVTALPKLAKPYLCNIFIEIFSINIFIYSFSVWVSFNFSNV